MIPARRTNEKISPSVKFGRRVLYLKELIIMAKFQNLGNFFLYVSAFGTKIFEDADRERIKERVYKIYRVLCGGVCNVAFGCTSRI